jgi:hypothetical protein
MATTISTAARNAACNAIVDLLDAGAGAGYIEIKTGSTIGSGTLLGTLTFSDPAFGNASTGVCTASSITSDTTADNSGTAGNFQCYDSDATAIIGGTAGVAAEDMVFDNATIVAGGTIACSSFTVNMPAS